MSERVTLTQFTEAEGTGDWRIVGDGACAFFATASLAQAARFVAGITAIPDRRVQGKPVARKAPSHAAGTSRGVGPVPVMVECQTVAPPSIATSAPVM